MAIKQVPLPNEQLLIEAILKFVDDPYGFVMYVFPWGEKGTPLANKDGPRPWQKRALIKIGNQLRENRRLIAAGKQPKMIRLARSSGRGIGKSAFLGWLGLFTFSCTVGSTTIVSANTEGQLKDTTFPEIKKWATMAIHSRWFELHSMSIRPAEWLKDVLAKTTKLDSSYWYIQARLWSDDNPDAFAGPHSQEGMTVLFDEASGIASNIWPVTQGYFTDATLLRIWVAISNPRNPSGEFFNCFHLNRTQWDTETIDARTIDENDQQIYADIITKYGKDSDQARVEVYGKFPRQGDNQFIGRGLVEEAIAVDAEFDPGAPLVMGVDPARMGDDNAEIFFRRGFDARSIPPITVPKGRLTALAQTVARAIDTHDPDAVFIEGDGVGGGLIDILIKMRYRVIEVSVGGQADDDDQWADRRTEIWAKGRSWMERGGAIDPHDEDLHTDMTAPLYEFNDKGRVKLESVKSLKKRGFASPNKSTALFLTLDRNVGRKSMRTRMGRGMGRSNIAKGVDYPLFS